ncbi:anaphase-promoting complex subunit CDC26 [Gadus morhua]|uniref:Anaphase-promoting complex subunit CDC26 n=1 Tax=Gadus morhua TaxID=8049 RepID=A0A8C5C765_GADMO|nr:anaphase-promoting complex subunit CDC26 [Gadus morhua]XP_056434272.1 anaphase-promoting complex subunit CDC26-like [Gadus chalcogrammus]XP_059895033.1 anaphase-promoting complex subunit CDC26 [Gadus macrocephalus]
MLRRKPTRLELKMDDTEEFESIKKELENRKRQREEVSCPSGGGASDGEPHPLRADVINERIGFKPTPKMAAPPTFFGNL